MLLTILGCSGSVPGPDAPASGYLLEADGFRLAVDFGNGTFAALSAIIDPFLLDAVLLSHLHADHCADLTALGVLRRYHPAPLVGRNDRALPVYAPVEAPGRFIGAYAVSEEERRSMDLSDVFAFHAVRQGTQRIGPFDVRSVPVDHPCDAYGFRISYDGVVLAYTGDTGPCPGLDELVASADAVLAEASWTHAPDRPPGLHLSGTQAGTAAARGGAGRLLVTHVPPWSDSAAILEEAHTAFGGPTTLVEQCT
ncbi:MAG: MBL fold metallo-hydrolase, partial [Sciscionella sp.]